MHKDLFFAGDKARCYASTSLPLSMPTNLSCFSLNESSNRDLQVQLPPEAETFEVTIQRNSLGLGLSIMGGPEASPPFKHLIRIKKLFPLQPAWQTGLIMPGDILLEANHQPLTGMSLRQALDILRCSPPVTTLLVCRPKSDFYADGGEIDHLQLPPAFSPKVARSYSYTPATRQLSLSMPPVEPENVPESMDCDNNRYRMSTPELIHPDDNPTSKSHPNTLDLFSPILLNNNNHNNNNHLNQPPGLLDYGEFTIQLRKVNGSLGFTLFSQTDDSTVLRHSVKALVKEPALSDGRIRAGDKLVTANGIECGHLSHQELIQFLRKCPEEVTLKFYRDNSRSQTPVSTPQNPNAPTESAKKSFFGEKSKLGNFFSNVGSSSSHPDLAFASQAPKPKQLRAEAKEMVRSLQASRNSLENGVDNTTRKGSNASGAGSRRKIRPFSPSRDRPQPNPICLSASAPSPFPKHLVAANIDSLSTSPVQSPTVESPMTPGGSDLVGSTILYHPDPHEHSSLGVERLCIEELSPDEVKDGSFSIGYTSHEFYTYSEQTHYGTKFERPRDLDLFGGNKRKQQQGFLFNK